MEDKFKRASGVMPHSDLIHLDKVTRVEVIDEQGRKYVRRDIDKVRYMFQDDGRTLKIFIN